MNRRTFLASATTLAAATATATVAAADAAPGPRRVRIGFLGVTYSHGLDKLRLTQKSPDWELIGAHDPTDAGAAVCARVGVPRLSREELFERAEVIAVESEVPDHARDARLALEAGKHVHVEKPVAMRPDEIEALITLAHAGKRLFQSGYMWRYNPGFTALFTAVRQGWLGDVLAVRAFMGTGLAPDRRSDWARLPGGSMFEQGSHLVDAVVRLLGRPRKVTPFLRHHGRFDDTLQDNNLAVLEYDRAHAVLSNTALQSVGTPRRSFEVLGSRGTATLAPIEPPTLVLDLAEPAGPYAKGPQTPALPAYRRYEGDFAELAAAVRGERPLGVSLDEERTVAETVLRAAGIVPG